MDAEIKSWLAFSVEKLEEISMLTKAVNLTKDAAVDAYFYANASCMAARAISSRIHDPAVQERVKAITPQMKRRKGDAATRFAEQKTEFNFPDFPTTTIGSLPQVHDIQYADVFT